MWLHADDFLSRMYHRHLKLTTPQTELTNPKSFLLPLLSCPSYLLIHSPSPLFIFLKAIYFSPSHHLTLSSHSHIIYAQTTKQPSQSLFSPSLLDAPNRSLLHQRWSLLSFHFMLKTFQWFPSALSTGEKSSLAPKTVCSVTLLTYPASFSQPLPGGTHTLREMQLAASYQIILHSSPLTPQRLLIFTDHNSSKISSFFWTKVRKTNSEKLC